MTNYPERLTPTREKPILELNVAFVSNQWIGRFHITTGAGTIFKNGLFDSSLVDYRRFPGLSCNFMPPSEPVDLQIRLLNSDLLNSWNPAMGTVIISGSDFEVDEAYEVYRLPFHEIVNSICDFEINEQLFQMGIGIAHKPLLGNYAHCEFVLYSNQNNRSIINKLSSKKSYHRILITFLRSLLENHAEPC